MFIATNVDLYFYPQLRAIYTVRLCRMRQAYDRPTTRIVSYKSSLQLVISKERCMLVFGFVSYHFLNSVELRWTVWAHKPGFLVYDWFT